MNEQSPDPGIMQLSSQGGEPAAKRITPPRRRWVSRLVLPAVILLAMLALIAWGARGVLLPAVEVHTTPVMVKPISAPAQTTAPATGGAVLVQAPGWLEPDPYPIYVSGLTDGVVERVLVLEGQRVTRGQVVAEMIDDDARLARDRALSELATARANLDAAQSDWDSPIELERRVAVTRAQLSESKSQRQQLDTTIEERRATVRVLKALYERYEKTESGVVSKLDADQARFRLDAGQARLASAEHRRAELDAQVARHTAERKAAERDLELRIDDRRALAIAKADAQAARVRLDEAELRLSRTKIVSPADGVVMQRLKSPGDKLRLAIEGQHTAHVVHLYDPKRLQVRVDVPLGEAAQVGVDQRAQVVVDVLPDRTFAGRVSRVVPQADIEKNTLEVKVSIDDPIDALKPEMLARVKFLETTTAAPAGAGAATGGRQSVGVFIPMPLVGGAHGAPAEVWLYQRSDSTARRRAITLGPPAADGWVRVTAGLKPGDAIITDAPGDLADGQRVKVIDPNETEAAR